MRKLPKRPRTFGRTKAKPYKKKQKPQMFLDFAKIFDELIDSPMRNWYINYDEHGQYKSMGIDFAGPRKEKQS